MTKDVETKLSAARTRLIIDKPFLGALVLRLPVLAAHPRWCPTTATDARGFYYNPDYIDALTPSQTEFVLAHEALHCALLHFARRQHRIKYRWDVACDYAINPLLVKDGLHMPPGTLVEAGFEGMTAEEIYPYIGENSTDEPMDRHVYDGEAQGGTGGQQGEPDQSHPDAGEDERQGDASWGTDTETTHAGELEEHTGNSPQPPPLSEVERASLSVQWQQRMAAAAQQARKAGKLGGEMARLVDHLLQPRLPWRMLLARYMSATGRDDFSYMRPSRREGEAILPSLRSAQIDIVLAVDTSGSITDQELSEFLAEIDALKGQLRARVTLLACDADLTEGCPWYFEPWEECRLAQQLQGGGGTRFSPVFDWVDRQDRLPDLLVYFTDGAGEFPPLTPPYPVLWLVKGQRSVPWGQRIQLN